MMRTNVAETSLAAFRSLPIGGYLQPKERAVMDLMTTSGAMTREQMARVLGWKESAICGRVNSLVAKGELEEIFGGKTASGRAAKLVRIPVGVQRELFQ